MTPFVAFQPVLLARSTEAELSQRTVGAGGDRALVFPADTTRSLPAFAGLQLQGEVSLADGSRILPFLRAAWVHEFAPDRRLKASFLAAPGFEFVVAGASAARNAAEVAAGAQVVVGERLGLFGSLEGRFSDKGNGYSAALGMQVSW